MREGENINFFIAFSSLFILCLPGRTDALHTWCLTGRAALPFRTLAPSVHPSCSTVARQVYYYSAGVILDALCLYAKNNASAAPASNHTQSHCSAPHICNPPASSARAAPPPVVGVSTANVLPYPPALASLAVRWVCENRTGLCDWTAVLTEPKLRFFCFFVLSGNEIWQHPYQLCS